MREDLNKEHSLGESYESHWKDCGSRLPVVLGEIEIAKNGGMTFDQIQEIMRVRYRALASTYKGNYWETCMYEGLLSSEGVLEMFFHSERQE